ncbi:hypothetical protein CRUP_027347 [Coryphaenoides rupestris]|nr:hypothetical protein CRUP_027347 [Coryphaenoides rupestris]
MQRPGGQGTAFSIDSLIGTPQPRPGHLLYTGYPMFMPYRPLMIPQALAHAPLTSGLPPLAPLASFAGRLTNTFCASLGQGVPSMVALTTTLPSFSDPPDSFYPPQELPGPRLSAVEPGGRRPQGSPHSDDLHAARDKGTDLLNFSETFQTISGDDQTCNSSRYEKMDLKCWRTRANYKTGLARRQPPDVRWRGGVAVAAEAARRRRSSSGSGSGSGSGSAGKSRRRRTAFTSEQLLELEKDSTKRRAKWKRIKGGNVNNRSGETRAEPQDRGAHPGARQQVRREESAPTNRARDQAVTPDEHRKQPPPRLSTTHEAPTTAAGIPFILLFIRHGEWADVPKTLRIIAATNHISVNMLSI